MNMHSIFKSLHMTIVWVCDIEDKRSVRKIPNLIERHSKFERNGTEDARFKEFLHKSLS